MADDFELRYGYRPWLVESFVDRSRHTGTCYQAFNWLEVGQTQGRGRQEKAHHMSVISNFSISPCARHKAYLATEQVWQIGD